MERFGRAISGALRRIMRLLAEAGNMQVIIDVTPFSLKRVFGCGCFIVISTEAGGGYSKSICPLALRPGGPRFWLSPVCCACQLIDCGKVPAGILLCGMGFTCRFHDSNGLCGVIAQLLEFTDV